MQFIGRARQCCIYFYTRSVIKFRGRKGLYKAAVGLQVTHYVTSHLQPLRDTNVFNYIFL